MQRLEVDNTCEVKRLPPTRHRVERQFNLKLHAVVALARSAGEGVQAIAQRYGLTVRTVRAIQSQYGWVEPRGGRARVYVLRIDDCAALGLSIEEITSTGSVYMAHEGKFYGVPFSG